jgi:hypothetical protein
MSRGWTEFVAAVGDVIPLGLLVLHMLVVAGLVGAAFYWWPRWLPTRWWPRRVKGARRRWSRPGLGWLRWLRFGWRRFRWRRRRAVEEPVEALPDATDELPDLPAEAFISLADRLAAEGRYAEAVRERLRGIVRQLVDAGVIEHRPGWTVTELAAAAGAARPPVRVPLDGASGLFSDIWYGQRPAERSHDEQMRGYALTVSGTR